MSGVRLTHVLNSFRFFKFKHNWGIFCFVLWGWFLGSEGLVNRRSGHGWGDVRSWAGYEFHTYPHPAKKLTLPRDIMVEVVNSLGLKLLAIHNEHNENNIAISPYGSLSILVALGEGLQGEAVKEVQKAAHLPNDISLIRIGLRDIHRHLKSYFIPKEGFLAGLTLNHDNVTLRPQYEEILKFYGFDIMSFNNALYPDPPTTEKPKMFTTTESPGREMTMEMTTPLFTTSTTSTTPTSSTTKEDEITSQKVDTTTKERETTSQKIDTTTAVSVTPEPEITTTVPDPKETTILSTTVEAVLPFSETTTTESSLKTTTESSLKTTTESSLKTTTEGSLKTTTEPILTTEETPNTSIRENSTTTEVSSTITTAVPSSTEQVDTTVYSSSESTIKTDVTTLQVIEDSVKEEHITESPGKSTMASTTATETTILETTTIQVASETTKETAESTTAKNQRESTTTVSEIETATREKQTTDEKSTDKITTTVNRTAKETTILETSTGQVASETTESTTAENQRESITTVSEIETDATREQQTTEAMSTDKITTTVNILTEQIITEPTLTESTTTEAIKEQETTQHIDTEQTTEQKTVETTTSVSTQETTTLLSFPYPDSSVPTNADITTELSKENEINISDGETSVRKRRFRARKNLVRSNNFKSNVDSRKTRSVVDYVVARYYDDQPYRDNFHPVHYPENYHLTPYVPQTHPSFFVQGKYTEYNVNYMKYDTVLPFFYASHLNAFALSFPLDSDKYYLLLLLPVDKNGINRLICDLRLIGSLKYVIDGLRYRHVTAIIPSFMLKGYANLTPTLQKLGIRRVFEPGQADFSPMTILNEIYITNIEQAITVNIKNYVDPDTLNNRRDYREDDPQEFRADHPFLYFVMDTELHVALMAGKIVNPLNSRIT